MKSSALLAVVLTLALPWPGISQIVARQGTAAESPLQDFKSPMILDLPLQDFKQIPSGSGRDFKEVRKYYCDDLMVSQLFVTKKEESHRGKPSSWRLEIRGAVSVRPSHDRLATIRFDAVKGEEGVATAQVSQINAEEGKTQSFKVRLNLAPDEVDRLFAAGEPPLLRVTVTVQDNS
jgi:hypothetical protein